MKQINLLLCFFFAINMYCYSQISNSLENEPPLISFKIKNSSLLPTKITVISYRPDQTGNGTSGYFMPPYVTKSLKFPVGTKIYIANSKQVNTVMSGAKISDQPPFLLVKQTDAGKSFDLK